MKIKDLPYKRVNYDDIKDDLLKIVDQIKIASCADEVIQLRDKFNNVTMDFGTMAALCGIRFCQNTKDEFYFEEKKYYDEKYPLLSDITIQYVKAFLGSPFRSELEKVLPQRLFTMYEFFLKSNDSSVISLRQEESEIVTEYSQLMGSMEFEFRGEKMPLSVLRGKLDDSDREVRKDAAFAIGRGMEAHADKLDTIYDKLVKLRHEIALKCGYKNYAEFSIFERGRYDYDMKDIDEFKKGVKKYLVPLLNEIKKETAKELGLDKITFYDSTLTLKGGEPRPFGDKDQIFAAALEMYKEMNPELYALMERMQENEAFDVVARDAKNGGGFCCGLDGFRQIFILANFNGSSGDIDVMTHEFGHAFAADCIFRFGDMELGLPGFETAESHSMGMEFMCWKYMDKFFGKDVTRYKYRHLNSSLSFIPYGLVIDEFQKRVYENPNMTPKQRKELYLELEKEYRPYIDWEGIPYLEEGTRWQYQMHVYETPFYYVDYTLAQTIALGFLVASLDNYEEGLNKYITFVKNSNKMYFRQLVAEAGLGSPFDAESFKRICEVSKEVLLKLKKEI